MDTLKRMGSIRKSLRRPKKTTAEVVEIPSGPPKRVFFIISVTDAIVAANDGFQPTHLCVVIDRNRRKRASTPVLWEASLKHATKGTGIWHPPFVCTLAVTPPIWKEKSATLRHKDSFISIENVDVKSKRKTLAKIRLNLTDYYNQNGPVSFKLKLRPESTKVLSAAINLTIERSDEDPTKASALAPPPNLLYEDALESASIGDDRLLASASPLSERRVPDIKASSHEFLLRSFPPPENDNEKREIVTSQQSLEQEIVLTHSKPKSPPPLPLRDWEKEDVHPSPRPVSSSPIIPPEPTIILPPLPKRDISNRDKIEKIPEIISQTNDKLPEIEQKRFDISPVLARKFPGSSKTPENTPDVSRISPELIKTPGKSPKITRESPEIVAEESAKRNAKRELDLPLKNEEEKVEFKTPMVVKTPELLDPPRTKNFSMKVPPSPKMMPNKSSSVEKDLLNWAKDFLKGKMKVTNLTTSWRNGMGFCALIHRKFPKIIPFEMLKMQEVTDNCNIAFEASKLIGIESDLITIEEFTSSNVPDKTLVITFLKELKSVLTSSPLPELPDDQIFEFQCKWYKVKGYFAKVVGATVDQQEQDRIKSEDEAKAALDKKLQEEREAEEVEKVRIEQEKFELDREERRKKLYENGQECMNSPAFEQDKDKRQKNISRVKDLIAEGHSSFEEDDVLKVEVTESNGKETAEVVVVEAVKQESVEEYPTFHESQTIAEELSDLVNQEKQVNREKEELEEILRDEQNCPNSMEMVMQKKYMQLVNKSNAIVRRQMQLNIEKQMKRTTYEMNKINAKLQKFSSVDESQKTEAMKNEEQELVAELLALVNKKDELVLHLDSQEKAIEVDEQILEAVNANTFDNAKQDHVASLQRLFFKHK